MWLDERRISPGEAWERETLTAVRRTVRLFVPIISANTEAEEEGYVFREWMVAIDRSRSIMGRRFIVPVVVDEDYDGDPSRYRQIPEDFRRLQFGRAPGGDPDAGLIAMLTSKFVPCGASTDVTAHSGDDAARRRETVAGVDSGWTMRVDPLHHSPFRQHLNLGRLDRPLVPWCHSIDVSK